MRSISVTPVMVSAFVAIAVVASASAWDDNPLRDGVTDEWISPRCRIGSLQSWQGQPCVVVGQHRLGWENNTY
jgi:hypothetical protein